MNTMKSALCAAFAVLVSVASAEVLPQLPTFYTWVKNPNKANDGGNGIGQRLAFIDTGVPAKSGIEVEADIQCDNTLFKNTYNKGLTGYGANNLVMPLCFNPGTSDTKDCCFCIGYGLETDVTTFAGGSLQTGETPFKLTTTGRYQVHVRLCAGEQWLDAKNNGDADYTRVITSSIPESYDTGTTLKLFGYKLTKKTNPIDWRSVHAAPLIIYSMKIYTVEGTGTDAVRTLVRDFAPCEAANEDGQTVPALYDIIQGKVYFNENKQVDSNGNVAGLVRSAEEATRADVLMISADPASCAPVTPSVGGRSGLTADYAETFTAPSGVIQIDESTKVSCKGWKLYEYNGETKTMDLKDSSTSLTCAYSHADAMNARHLVWEWEEVINYPVSATTEDPTATVTASKDAAEPGEEVTFTAIAGEGRVFWKWTGDVPAEHVYDAVFTMPITKPTALVAVFGDRIPVAVGGDIQAALNGASAGDVVELMAGDYPVTATLTVDDGKKLVGAGRELTRIVLDAALANDSYIVTLTDPDSEIAGLTITATDATADYKCEGGLKMTGGLFADGRITGLYGKTANINGLGVNMTGGTLLHTEIAGNLLETSGGSHDGPAGVYMTGGFVDGCRIVSNTVNYSTSVRTHGGGLKITGGMVKDTLIAWNTDYERTAGVFATGGTLENCTITGNMSPNADRWGGVYNDGATFVGCTIGGNTCFKGNVVYNVRKGASGTFTDCTILDDSHPGTPILVEVDSVEAFMAALGSACDGSVITLAPGDYTLSQTVYLTNAVTVVGRGEVNVTAGKSVRAFFLRNPNAVLKNLSIRDCTATAVTMLDGGKVSGCTFTGNHASSGSGGTLRMTASGTVEASRFVKNCLANSGRDECGGAISYEGRDGVLDRCLFVSNSIAFTKVESSRFSMGSALHVMGSMRIRSCLFARNYYSNSHGAGAIMFENTDGSWISGGEGSQLENCTIVDNSTSAPRVSAEFYADTVAGVALNDGAYVTGANCIIDGNVDYAGAISNVYVRSGCVFNLTYSDVDAGSSVAGGEGNISEDPLFKNRAANNYQLAADSPCVNTGTNADWMAEAVDLRGKPRIAEGIVDMGAYERQNTGLLMLVR